jgi:predicted transcriptional regulator
MRKNAIEKSKKKKKINELCFAEIVECRDGNKAREQNGLRYEYINR